jgi:hypothetical protein
MATMESSATAEVTATAAEMAATAVAATAKTGRRSARHRDGNGYR